MLYIPIFFVFVKIYNDPKNFISPQFNFVYVYFESVITVRTTYLAVGICPLLVNSLVICNLYFSNKKSWPVPAITYQNRWMSARSSSSPWLVGSGINMVCGRGKGGANEEKVTNKLFAAAARFCVLCSSFLLPVYLLAELFYYIPGTNNGLQSGALG